MLKKRIHSLRIVAGLILTLVRVIGISGVACADRPRAALVILSGGLFESATTMKITNNNTVTQNGQDQLLPIRMLIPVTDATGTGAGWMVTLKSTAFSDRNGHILNNMPRVSRVLLTLVSGSSSTVPGNTTAYTNYTIPTGTARTLFNATVNTGMGEFILTAMMNLKIQQFINVRTSYTSMYTLAIVSGPQ